MTAYSPNPYERALQVLGRLDHADLLAAYKQFVSRLQTILTPAEQEIYASFQQRTQGGVRPEEQAVADKVAADAEALPLYEQYLTVLKSAEPPTVVEAKAKRGR
ncbi:MAG: hypothetical protein H0X37_01700 [Herpetosiphonaceae bacterium]|nr:hypothetical protein [Herpetosiphonaceae bacterium]